MVEFQQNPSAQGLRLSVPLTPPSGIFQDGSCISQGLCLDAGKDLLPLQAPQHQSLPGMKNCLKVAERDALSQVIRNPNMQIWGAL